MALGRVEWIEIGFPGSKLSPDIVQPLKELVDTGTIHIVDLMVLHKDGNGTVAALELEGLEPDEAALFRDLDGDVLGLLNEDDIAFVGETLAPDSSAAVLVWENLWVTRFVSTVAAAGGWLAGHGEVPGEVAEAALQAASAESESA